MKNEEQKLMEELAYAQIASYVRAGEIEKALDLALQYPDVPQINIQIGSFYEALGRVDEALAFQETHIFQLADETRITMVKMMVAQQTMAKLFKKKGEHEAALSCLEGAYRIIVETLSMLEDDTFFINRSKAQVCMEAAEICLQMKDVDRAFPYCKEFHELMTGIQAQDPESLDAMSKLTTAKVFMGDYYGEKKQYRDALVFYLVALKMAQELTAIADEDIVEYQSLLGLCNGRLGRVNVLIENFPAAIKYYQQVCDIYAGLFRQYPKVVVFLENTLMAMKGVTSLYYQMGDEEKAWECAEKIHHLVDENRTKYPALEYFIDNRLFSPDNENY